MTLRNTMVSIYNIRTNGKSTWRWRVSPSAQRVLEERGTIIHLTLVKTNLIYNSIDEFNHLCKPRPVFPGISSQKE